MSVLMILGILISFSSQAVVNNLDTGEISVEYGLAYHTLKAAQKSNGSRARFTSSQNPFAQFSFTHRFSQNWQWRATGGFHFVQFNEPKGGTIQGETTVLKNYGLEVINKLGSHLRFVGYGRSQDQAIYETISPNVYQILHVPFAQIGARLALVQRRRIGFLWAMGAGTYILLPTKGGDVVTEGGYGAEAYLRLGWVGFGGVTYQLKGGYTVAQVPNAEVNFTHEILGYSAVIAYAF